MRRIIALMGSIMSSLSGLVLDVALAKAALESGSSVLRHVIEEVEKKRTT